MEVIKSISSLFGSTLEELKRRVSSPLAGTFFLTWLLVNWDFVYYFLFSESKVEVKISHIHNYFLSVSDTLGWPVFITIAYIIVYPLISSLSDAIWVFMERSGKQIASLFLEHYSVITREEQASLYRQMREKEEEYKAKIEELKKANDALYTSVNTLSIQTEDERLEDEVSTEHNYSELPKEKVDRLKQIASLKYSFDSVDGSYRLTDFVAKEFKLDKDDKYDSKDIMIIKQIIKNALIESPEPWYVKQVAIKKDGVNISFVDEHVKAVAKRLVRQQYLKVSEKGKIGDTDNLAVLPSSTLTSKLLSYEV